VFAHGVGGLLGFGLQPTARDELIAVEASRLEKGDSPADDERPDVGAA